METTFKALVIEETNSTFTRNIKTKSTAELPPGEVLIQVKYSSLNYKDALSATGNKGITRNYPHTPGIDAAGIVIESTNLAFKAGDKVICMGYDLGMNTAGGFGQFIRVPANWIVPCPQNISLRTAMIIGTAGFTAMNGMLEIIKHNVATSAGKVVVSGATGGVGIMATTFLTAFGYDVIASSGKTEHYNLLQKAGAKDIQGREMLSDNNNKPLTSQKWIAGIDTVGGNVLTNIIKATGMYGIVATCGNVISADFQTSIFPFILRGVRLIGLASAETPITRKFEIWDKINTKFADFDFDFLTKEVTLEGLSNEIDLILKGKQAGRVIVNLE